MRPNRPRERYDAVAIFLHWTMAAGILVLIAIGLVMTHASLSPARTFGLYQLHKSIGITILLAAGLRLAWRLSHGQPKLADSLPWEKIVASGVHRLIYALLFALPLSGWAVVSASPLGLPTFLFRVVPWPHLPFLSDLTDKSAVETMLALVHAWGAYAFAAIVVLHAGAALRHRYVLHDDVLGRMLPWRPARSAPGDEALS
ncbi:cytochrome b [Polymorphobacter sp. PAMC 29334]|uniref:cytochrome b n=1 Tax=Polymorphobacter sp. PAMC 29334 TaxID=2862331 RepID=UPI001C66F0F9|nr:cytochrome b [Polymorphobacter sp. PAMC 29334]QYE36330.1 cytochrome b [Polymorphobacter sp. PAMC 29334]